MDGFPGQPQAVTISILPRASGPLWIDVVALRRQVFGEEQGIVDWELTDSDDASSIHAVATLGHEAASGAVVAAGRITLHNQGRDEAIVAWVATAEGYRRRGIGREIMQALLDEADRAGIGETVLAAQRHAEAFYASLGFLPSGGAYRVRGIPHRWMIRRRPG
ncbi:MAG: GNAT family N-acetyltransferase [Chloroflexota bacterium]